MREVQKVTELRVGQKLLLRRGDKYIDAQVLDISTGTGRAPNAGRVDVRLLDDKHECRTFYDDYTGEARIGAYLYIDEDEPVRECPSNECAIRNTCTGHAGCTGERKCRKPYAREATPCTDECAHTPPPPPPTKNYIPEGVCQVTMQLTKESPKAVSDWAVATFGEAGTNASCAARANKEMGELLMDLTNNDSSPKAGEEIADVIICLYRLADRLGVNVFEEIDRKMKINRDRKWNLDGHGHGYHVKEE